MGLRQSTDNIGCLPYIITFVVGIIICFLIHGLFGIDFIDEHSTACKMIFIIVGVVVFGTTGVKNYKKNYDINTDNPSFKSDVQKDDSLSNYYIDDMNLYKEQGKLSDIESITDFIKEKQNCNFLDSSSELLELYFERGKIFNYLYKDKEAINDFTKAIQISKTINQNEFINMANQAYNSKNYLNALFYNNLILSRKLTQSEDISEIYYTRGMIYKELKQLQKAMQDFQTAINETKAYSNTLGYLEVEEYERKRIPKYTQALENCRKEISEYEIQLAHERKRSEIKNKLDKKNIDPKNPEQPLKVTTQDDVNAAIILESCTELDLLTIDGFDEEKAERFLSERKNGKKYYDLETFAMDYELQPHQMIMLEDKLIFSQKPINKFGRKVDF